MLYVIYAECITASIDLKHLQLLQNQGRLLTAGIIPTLDSCDPGAAGFNGYTIIAEFDCLEIAQAWVEHNIVTSSVYTTVIVKPYKKIL